jgi:transposase
VLARAAELTCAHYLPVARATALMTSMLGVQVSAGFTAGVRARAARLLEMTFLPRVRDLLRQAGVLHADETPGRADGGLSYVHVACTEFLTVMHTGGRGKADIDAGQVLPGYTGTIVRDGYAGYTHLIDAHHAWCGAHYPDLRIIRTSARSVLVGGGARAGVVGIITALRGTRAAGRGAGSGRGCWSAGWSGSALALSA